MFEKIVWQARLERLKALGGPRVTVDDLLLVVEAAWEDGYREGVESESAGHYEAMNAAEYD